LPIKKTSISIDKDLWFEWTRFVLERTGSSRKISEELENAIREYMAKHRRGKSA